MCACSGHTSGWHYVEAVLTAGALASLILHLSRVIRRTPSPHNHNLLSASVDDSINSEISTFANVSADTVDVWPGPDMLRWRAQTVPQSSPSPPRSPPLPPSPTSETFITDAFIADASTLAAYLRAHAQRPGVDEPVEERSWISPVTPPSPPLYQLASSEAERGPLEEGGAVRTPQVWRRLHLDPQRLTQWNLNLRLVSGQSAHIFEPNWMVR